MKRTSFKAGDKVSFKGNLWRVQYESNGMVKIVRDTFDRTVKVDQVKLEAS
jgi:hypothetical protein